MEQISQPPGADRNATVVAPYRPWDWDGRVQPMLDGLMPPGGGLPLIVAATPTTQSVRLVWAPLPDAAGYRLYRNLFPAQGGRGAGLAAV